MAKILAPGASAPDFTLRRTPDQSESLHEFRGQPLANENLKELKVAILVDDGFEQVELVEPRKALDQAGAQTSMVSPKNERVRGWNFTDWGGGKRPEA